MEILNNVVLVLSGLLLTYAGASRFFKPLKSYCLKVYLDDSSLKLEGKVDVFNEMRAAGASLALGGIVIFLGVFFQQLQQTSFILALVIFFGNAIGRLLSLSSDGKPNKELSQGLMSELIFHPIRVTRRGL